MRPDPGLLLVLSVRRRDILRTRDTSYRSGELRVSGRSLYTLLRPLSVGVATAQRPHHLGLRILFPQLQEFTATSQLSVCLWGRWAPGAELLRRQSDQSFQHSAEAENDAFLPYPPCATDKFSFLEWGSRHAFTLEA
jgi:hypothetical protein